MGGTGGPDCCFGEELFVEKNKNDGFYGIIAMPCVSNQPVLSKTILDMYPQFEWKIKQNHLLA